MAFNIVGNIYIRPFGKDGAEYGMKLWNKTCFATTNCTSSSSVVRPVGDSSAQVIRGSRPAIPSPGASLIRMRGGMLSTLP